MAIAESLILQVKADTGKAVSDMNRFTGATQKSTSGIKALVLGIGAAVASVYTLRKAFDFAKNAAQIGAQANQIRTALDNMAKRAGTTADSIVREMQEMSGGTIDQLRIMESASKAALLGIPLERLDELMQVARASATALGTDVGTMFNDLATGIGRQSKMILDNLGINISAEKAYSDYAATLGKTSAQLTDNERRQGFLNAVLEDGKRIMEEVGEAGSNMTATEPWQMMTSAITDAKIALGEKLFPLFNQGALKVATMVRDMIKYMNNLPATFDALGNIISVFFEQTFSWDMIKANVADMAVGFFNVWKESIFLIPKMFLAAIRISLTPIGNFGEWIVDIFQNVWARVKNAAVNSIGDLLSKVGIEIERKAIPPVMTFGEVFKDTVADMGKGYADFGKELWSTLTKNIDSYGKMLGKLAENYKDNPAMQEALAQLNAIKEEADTVADKLAAAAGTPETSTGGMENVIPVYEGVVDVLKEMNRAQIDVMSAIAVTGDRAARAAEEEIVPAYKDVIETLKELNRTTIDHKSNVDVLADSYKQIEEKTSEAVRAIRPFSDAIGQMATDASEGMEMLKNATTSAIATMLEALAKEAFGRAAVAAGIGMLPGGQLNIPGAIALAAAGTALMVSAGFVRGLKEGGIVTKPTHALIGEAGPEAVIPLNKAGGMMGVTVNQYIRGSVLSERQLQRFAVSGLAKVGRRY